MPDALPRIASVAVVPCFNEGRNPIDLAAVLLAVPDLQVVFVDDGSEGASREALDALTQRDTRVRVVRNDTRVGKVASLTNVMRALDSTTRRILLVDCDVVVPVATLQAVLDELERADLVLANAGAIPRARTIWERGAIFSANRHERLRRRALDRYPALFSNGRLLGVSRRLADAIVRGDVPRHTEDAHFMLVALTEGFTYAYRADARLQYRAPGTLGDYLRQSNRFSQGRELLRERWPSEVLARYYDPKPGDLLATFLAEALHDPLGAAVFASMLAAKAARAGAARPQDGAWAVADSTKALR
jgi:cellulose synthase/poly-beta-1,6-N-acetylglucosamine synthase-like glycosyltransferase